MRITLGKMCDGNLSVGDDREATIFANGKEVGTLTVYASHQTYSGLTSSGDRYSASEVTAEIWPRDLGIKYSRVHALNGKTVEHVAHTVEMYRRGVRVLTTAQAKRAARVWVAETLTNLASEASR